LAEQGQEKIQNNMAYLYILVLQLHAAFQEKQKVGKGQGQIKEKERKREREKERGGTLMISEFENPDTLNLQLAGRSSAVDKA